MHKVTSGRFSTCPLLRQGKDIGYSLNSPTWASRWTSSKWQTKHVLRLQSRKSNTWFRNCTLQSDITGSKWLGFLGREMWRLQTKDTRLWFVKIKRMAAFLDKMALQTIRRIAWQELQWEHFHLSASDSGHQHCSHLHSECHQRHPVSRRKLNLPKPNVYPHNMCTYLLLHTTCCFSILLHTPQITSAWY